MFGSAVYQCELLDIGCSYVDWCHMNFKKVLMAVTYETVDDLREKSCHTKNVDAMC